MRNRLLSKFSRLSNYRSRSGIGIVNRQVRDVGKTHRLDLIPERVSDHCSR